MAKHGQQSEQSVVSRLKVMYGDQPPNDATTLALVRLTVHRLKEQVRKSNG